MEFIAENYIWFIIGGVVILMTIIGYIADKTNFTKKEENREKIKHSKKNKVEKIEEELPEDEPVVGTPEINPIEDFNMDFAEPAFETDEPEITENQDLVNEGDNSEITDFDEEYENAEETNENFVLGETPVETEEANENVVLDETPVEAEEINENIALDENPVETEEDLYVGLDGTPNAYKEIENSEETNENLEIELPSLSSLDNELKEETDEDDVWKF